MRIGRYLDRGEVQIGAIFHDRVHKIETSLDVLGILNLPQDEQNALVGASGRKHRQPIEEVHFLPPVEPRAMRDFLTFEAHIAGMKKSFDGDGSVPEAWYEAPGFLFMSPWTIYGPTDDIPMPPLTQRLDYELEVGMVVKKMARNITADEARDYIAGYCVFNDWSARDIQGREMQVGLGPNKGKDFANSFGPWITTPDELEEHREGDRYDLEMTVSVNGKEYGRDNVKNMSWSFEELLAHAARGSNVGPGDILASGTAGTGAMSELWSRSKQYEDPAPLQVGDVVEMTIEGLGTLRNRVVECDSPHPDYQVPRARRTYPEDRL